jgi:hypothetical protein
MPNAKGIAGRAIQGGAPEKIVKKAAQGVKAGKYTGKQVARKAAAGRPYGGKI